MTLPYVPSALSQSVSTTIVLLRAVERKLEEDVDVEVVCDMIARPVMKLGLRVRRCTKLPRGPIERNGKEIYGSR